MDVSSDGNGRRPECPSCGGEMKCPGCDDTRPVAKDLHRGWRFRSPLDRWETVVRTDHEGYGPIRIWTEETGPDYCWLLWGSAKVDAVRPPLHYAGTPEIRIVEYDWGDGPMYAIPTMSTINRPDISNPLVEARFVGRGKGWTVAHRPGGGELVTLHCASKAEARSAVRSAARAHAKALRVKVVLPQQTGAR